jgi:hypothetical protein
MKQYRPTHEHSLESFRYFPHIAWAITILFTVFVINLTRTVSKEVTALYSLEHASAEVVTPVRQ